MRIVQLALCLIGIYFLCWLARRRLDRLDEFCDAIEDSRS